MKLSYEARYKYLVDKADRLAEEIETCEAYLDAMLSFTHKHGDRYQITMMEDMLDAIFKVESNCREHLRHIRFEKALLSCRMQKQV